MEEEYSGKVIILTASGGGGLLQAAKAKEQQIKKRYPKKDVVVIDVMYQWLGTLGRWGSNRWNQAQRRGDVSSQTFLGYLQILADFLFWPTIFFYSCVTFFKENVERVIDTQPLCTSATVKALRLLHFFKKKKVFIEKVIVDLPTKRSVHFFRGIKQLSKKDKSYVRIVSMKPFLEDVDTTKDFWKKYCNISESAVLYEEFYIRNGFTPYIRKPRDNENPCEIFIRTKEKEESKHIEAIINSKNFPYTKSETGYHLTVHPDDRLFIVLLGTQPAYTSTCAYVKNIIDIVKKIPNKRLYHLFVFCAEFSNSKKSLFQRVIDVIKKETNYPENLNIIPMCFQDSSTIGALFHRSDVSITRSGGQTMMELMGVATGQAWVHSETKKNKPEQTLTYNQLFKGLPSWEAGNAAYFCKEYGGRFVTPELLEEMIKNYL